MPDLIRHPDSSRRKSGTISYTGSRFSPGTLDSGLRRNDDLSGYRWFRGLQTFLFTFQRTSVTQPNEKSLKTSPSVQLAIFSGSCDKSRHILFGHYRPHIAAGPDCIDPSVNRLFHSLIYILGLSHREDAIGV